MTPTLWCLWLGDLGLWVQPVPAGWVQGWMLLLQASLAPQAGRKLRE